jgi:hypothetical protein
MAHELTEVNIDSDDIQFEEITNSSGFGGGLELLMNTSRKTKSGSSGNDEQSDVDLSELKELSDQLDTEASMPSRKKTSMLFGRNDDDDDDAPALKLNLGNDSSEKPRLVEDETKNRTWDGFQKMSNIPNEADKAIPEQKLKKEDVLREKFVYLRKLEALEQKGVRLTKQYSMESNLDEMKGEYEMIVSEKEKSNSVKFQGKMLMACITGLEFLNNKFDPFDLKLDGWAEQVNENITDYDEIFSELHEKYHSKAKMAPELKLMFQLAGSAIMLHMTNSMFKSSMPNMDDYFRQHPEVMKQFTKAAVDTMGDSNPGFGGFMNSVMGGGGSSARPEPTPSMMGPPPPAIQTKGSHPGRAGGYTPNRPDISVAQMPAPVASSTRSEMKGPSDISSILEGLKRKEPQVTKKVSINTAEEEGSTISAQDASELNGKRIPKSRRKRSEKNTISLDL